MNIGTVITWILSNTGVITSVIQGIETIATDLQNLHGNNSLDAYAKAILAAIEGFFSSIGANTTTTTAEQATAAGAVTTMQAVTSAAAAPGLSGTTTGTSTEPPGSAP